MVVATSRDTHPRVLPPHPEFLRRLYTRERAG